jgi:hypothetical protein
MKRSMKTCAQFAPMGIPMICLKNKLDIVDKYVTDRKPQHSDDCLYCLAFFVLCFVIHDPKLKIVMLLTILKVKCAVNDFILLWVFLTLMEICSVKCI